MASNTIKNRNPLNLLPKTKLKKNRNDILTIIGYKIKLIIMNGKWC